MFVVGWAERTAAVCRIQAYQLELSVFGTEITAPQALSEGSFPFVNSLISRRLSAESLMMMSNSNFQSHKLWIIDRMQPRRTTAIPEGTDTAEVFWSRAVGGCNSSCSTLRERARSISREHSRHKFSQIQMKTGKMGGSPTLTWRSGRPSTALADGRSTVPPPRFQCD